MVVESKKNWCGLVSGVPLGSWPTGCQAPKPITCPLLAWLDFISKLNTLYASFFLCSCTFHIILSANHIKMFARCFCWASLCYALSSPYWLIPRPFLSGWECLTVRWVYDILTLYLAIQINARTSLTVCRHSYIRRAPLGSRDSTYICNVSIYVDFMERSKLFGNCKFTCLSE